MNTGMNSLLYHCQISLVTAAGEVDELRAVRGVILLIGVFFKLSLTK